MSMLEKMPREKRSVTDLKAAVVMKKKQRKAAELGKSSKSGATGVTKLVVPKKSILKPTKIVPTKSTTVAAVGAKRHAKPTKDAQTSITWPVIIRFARTAGCKRIQKMPSIIRKYMLEKTRELARGSVVFTDCSRKKTVSQSHVQAFATYNGGSLYTSNY